MNTSLDSIVELWFIIIQIGCMALTVLIITQQANRYIVASHIAISRYRIKLLTMRWRSSDVGRRVGTLVYTDMRSPDASICRCRSAVFLQSAD